MHAAGWNDKLYGNEGDDWLNGDTGQDMLHGDEDNDRVKGHMSGHMVFGGPETTSCGGTAHKTNDGARDVIDCGEGKDTVIYTPGGDMIPNCENLNPPEPE